MSEEAKLYKCGFRHFSKDILHIIKLGILADQGIKFIKDCGEYYLIESQNEELFVTLQLI